MYLAIITLPLFGSIISGFFGRKIGVTGAHIITCACVTLTMLLSIVIFFEVGLNNIPVSIQLFRWVDSESLNVLWGFYFDSLTVSMLIPVLIVSCLVHIYSIGYMSHDPHNQRFFSYLSLFTFMMIILVTANNFLLMFVGWEGVGICSYLLVSFWYTRIAANQSSMSAFLTNRVGDCFLTIGMFVILWSFGNIDYCTVFSLAPYINQDIITIIGICLLIGAMAKSSQIGLHVWLPMAMEGPTPVSALIHAATMVTAGVYLLMRTSPLIEYSSTVLILCLWIGAITTLFSSLIGLFQQDIKKVIAYSTMSQLGMMVIAIGLSSYNIALFHLINHAFYKGLLFLGAGAVIHSVADNQDFRKYGGLASFLPLTYSVMLIASLSLVAFPFMTGFYSKDFILESAYGHFHFSSVVVYFIAITGAMFTTLYSVKVLYLTFLANPNGSLVNYKKVHESDIYMSLPLIVLAIFSIFFGYITKDMFIGLGSHFFSDNGLFIHPLHEIMLDTEFAVPTLFKLLPLFFTIVLSAVSIILLEFSPKSLTGLKLSNIGYKIFSFFNQRFYIELFYNRYISGLILKLGGQTTKIIDRGSVELLGPFGLENALLTLSKHIASLDTGIVTSYALYILVGLIFYSLIPYLLISDNSILILILFGLLSTIKTKSFADRTRHLNRNDIGLLQGNIFISYCKCLYVLLCKKFFSIKNFFLFCLKLKLYYSNMYVLLCEKLYSIKKLFIFIIKIKLVFLFLAWWGILLGFIAKFLLVTLFYLVSITWVNRKHLKCIWKNKGVRGIFVFYIHIVNKIKSNLYNRIYYAILTIIFLGLIAIFLLIWYPNNFVLLKNLFFILLNLYLAFIVNYTQNNTSHTGISYMTPPKGHGINPELGEGSGSSAVPKQGEGSENLPDYGFDKPWSGKSDPTVNFSRDVIVCVSFDPDISRTPVLSDDGSQLFYVNTNKHTKGRYMEYPSNSYHKDEIQLYTKKDGDSWHKATPCLIAPPNPYPDVSDYYVKMTKRAEVRKESFYRSTYDTFVSFEPTNRKHMGKLLHTKNNNRFVSSCFTVPKTEIPIEIEGRKPTAENSKNLPKL